MKILDNIIFTHTFSIACVVFKRLLDKSWDNWAWELVYISIAVYCALIILISISEKVSAPADALKTNIPLYFRYPAKTASAFICVCVLLMILFCDEHGSGNIYALICLCTAAAASVKLLLIKEKIKAEFKNKQ